jgi:FSR family fosmidomycin resistance protein-like MFS transporter
MSTAAIATPNALRQDASLIGLIGLAHLVSHFSQLLLAPLFPWIKDAFDVSYAQLGLLLTVFFVVSCSVQALSGFWVDRYGPRPILFVGLSLIAVAAFGYSLSTNYAMLMLFSVLAGAGNGVFHPADFTLINRKVSAQRLGHAYSAHGITGSLGWAVAPALLVPLTLAYNWRVALACAGLLVVVVIAVLWVNRHQLLLLPAAPVAQPDPTLSAETRGPEANTFGFLRIPAVWACFTFFFIFAIALSLVQVFAPQAARYLHGVPLALVGICITSFMVASAGGMVLGGFLVKDPLTAEKVVGSGFVVAAGVALVLGLATLPAVAVPVLFAFMGFSSGIVGPSRDLLVKRATPVHATGRVYGVVYSGLDIGQAISPLLFGVLMDQAAYRTVFIGLALVFGLLVLSTLSVQRARRTPTVVSA